MEWKYYYLRIVLKLINCPFPDILKPPIKSFYLDTIPIFFCIFHKKSRVKKYIEVTLIWNITLLITNNI